MREVKPTKRYLKEHKKYTQTFPKERRKEIIEGLSELFDKIASVSLTTTESHFYDVHGLMGDGVTFSR